MARTNISLKQLAIDKANGMIVMVTGGACFVVIFCLVSSFTLINQMHYQSKVIKAKKTTLATVKSDLAARDTLVDAYKGFVSTSKNVLGGDPNGTNPQDGDNGRIVLDALPSKYDFPALANSIQAILSDKGVKINNIGGTDDEVAQSATPPSNDPQPVAIPFQVTAEGSYEGVQDVVNTLDKSIRPMQIQTMAITAGGSASGSLSVNLTAQTFYQPEKVLNAGKTVIK